MLFWTCHWRGLRSSHVSFGSCFAAGAGALGRLARSGRSLAFAPLVGARRGCERGAMNSDATLPALTEPFTAAMLLYPGFTLLDLIGPHAVLALAAKVHLVARTR